MGALAGPGPGRGRGAVGAGGAAAGSSASISGSSSTVCGTTCIPTVTSGSMRRYKLISKKGEGTFSEVVRAQSIDDGRYHAVKCMKGRFASLQQVNELREIRALRKLSIHPNIVELREVLFDVPTGRLAMVFELLEANLYELSYLPFPPLLS